MNEKRPIPPLWPFLLACAIVAVLIDFGTLHRGQHSDSIVACLMSLYRWTPYFWELDRGGTLVPLLAIPFRHPLANVLFQAGVNVFATLAAFLLLARYMLRDASYPVVGLLAASAFVALPAAYLRSEIFLNSGYGAWMALGLVALLLVEGRGINCASWPRLALAALLMVVVHWAYCTAAMFLVPLVLFRAVFRPTSVENAVTEGPSASDSLSARLSSWLRSESATGLLLLGIGCAAGFGLKWALAPVIGTRFGSLPVRDWLPTLGGLVSKIWSYLDPEHGPLLVLSAGGVGLVLLAIPAVRRQSQSVLRSAAALAATGVILSLFLATREHVKANEYSFRYMAHSAMFVEVALFAVAVGPLCLAVGSMARKGIYAGTVGVLLFAALIAYGVPSLSGVRADLATQRIPVPDPPDGELPSFKPYVGMSPAEILDAHCTHIAGGYWQVWTAVFDANLALRDQGEHRVVWGITLRSSPTQRYWSRVPPEQMRVAIPAGGSLPGDPSPEDYLNAYGFPKLVVVEKRSTIWVLRPESVARAERTQ
jgi:hypothetical protein